LIRSRQLYAASASLRRLQIIISHRLNDIFEVGDRVTVLKRGRNVGEHTITETTEKEALELIVSGVLETIADATLSV
jgi:simple sugar transport system ATP-binding protein